jgi:iron(III) transport system substrate-binding protein
MTHARRAAVGTLAVVVALALSACGKSVTSGSGGGGGSTAGGSADQVYQQLNSLPADQQRAKAIEMAKKEGTLSLYTSLTEDLTGPVKDGFEKATGVKMTVFRGNSETVLQRIQQETSANRTGNDAVETNFGEMGSLSKQGVLADYRGSAYATIPEAGRFPGWLADRLNIMLPAWNTNLIKPGQEPRSWEDLADPRFKGKITMELSDSDWYENVTKSWERAGKSQAEIDGLWQKIVANANVAKGHTVMAELLGAGQTAVDAMNYSYITQTTADKGAPVAFRSADGVAHTVGFARPQGVSMMKDAKHPAAAWLFNDWMLNEGQKLLVSLGLTPSVKVAGDDSLQGVTLEPYDVQGLTADSKTWDDRYDRLLRGLKQIGGD